MTKSIWKRLLAVLPGALWGLVGPLPAQEAPATSELDELRAKIEAIETRRDVEDAELDVLRRRLDELDEPGAATPVDDGAALDAALDQAIETAEREAAPEGTSSASTAGGGAEEALDRALADLPADGDGGGDLYSYPMGAVTLRAVDLSVDLLFAVGASTERDADLQNLQGGGHDPRRRGFNLQSLELSFTGAVDPYFTGDVHVVWFLNEENESRVELEEAFLTSMQLPFGADEAGFQLEAGMMLTEFGRINPRHPHAWDWLDQPVAMTRFFGPDGMRGPGLRLGWLLPIPWFSELHFGVQDARGEIMASFLANEEYFEERPIGGRPFVDQETRSLADFVYLGRWVSSWDPGEQVSMAVGASVVTGPNATGADGLSLIYGADFVLKWQPLSRERGWPFVVWQTEIARRDYRAASYFDPGDPNDPNDNVLLTEDTLEDLGLYTQLLWGFVRNWATGVRFEYASGSGESVGVYAGRADDPFRDDRIRVSPLLVWQATHFSRIRLQYNLDRAQHLDRLSHTVWMGFEILFGQHPVHDY